MILYIVSMRFSVYYTSSPSCNDTVGELEALRPPSGLLTAATLVVMQPSQRPGLYPSFCSRVHTTFPARDPLLWQLRKSTRCFAVRRLSQRPRASTSLRTL